MRYGLNGGAAVLPAHFPFNQPAMDFSRGRTRVSGEGNIHKTLIMAQVKVRGGAVVCYKSFAMSLPLP